MQEKSYIGFVFGGDSSEHDVSIVTTLGIDKLIKYKVDFTRVYIYFSKDKKFFIIPNDKMNVDTFKNNSYLKFKQVDFTNNGELISCSGIFRKQKIRLDAVINCCHGGDGENGVLSAYFRMKNIAFSTHNPLALGLAMDKNLFKLVLRGAKINVVDWVHVTSHEYKNNKDEVLKKIKNLKFPLVIKPNAQGSSLGVTVARNLDELYSAIDVGFMLDDNIIVEKMVENKVEFNCAVLGAKDDIIVSDVDQIESSSELFSFDEKYIGEPNNPQNSSAQETCGLTPNTKFCKGLEYSKRLLPAPISEELSLKIQELSYSIFSLLGLTGIARVDFFYDSKKRKLFVGEVNAVPGSLALYFFSKSNLKVEGVIKKLIEISKLADSKKHIEDKLIPKIF